MPKSAAFLPPFVILKILNLFEITVALNGMSQSRGIFAPVWA